MDIQHDYLRRAAKDELLLERLVGDTWLVSTYPKSGEKYTPLMAFSNAQDMLKALPGLIGVPPEPSMEQVIEKFKRDHADKELRAAGLDHTFTAIF